MTISFEVKVVSTLLNIQKAKNNFLPDDPDFFAALNDKYAKNPVKSIEIQTYAKEKNKIIIVYGLIISLPRIPTIKLDGGACSVIRRIITPINGAKPKSS